MFGGEPLQRRSGQRGHHWRQRGHRRANIQASPIGTQRSGKMTSFPIMSDRPQSIILALG